MTRESHGVHQRSLSSAAWMRGCWGGRSARDPVVSRRRAPRSMEFTRSPPTHHASVIGWPGHPGRAARPYDHAIHDAAVPPRNVRRPRRRTCPGGPTTALSRVRRRARRAAPVGVARRRRGSLRRLLRAPDRPRRATCGEVVGTYRLLSRADAERAGGFYAETEFHLGAIVALPALVEVGRACIHPDIATARSWRSCGPRSRSTSTRRATST